MHACIACKGRIRLVHRSLQFVQQGQHMLLHPRRRRTYAAVSAGNRTGSRTRRLVSLLFLLLALRAGWICCCGGRCIPAVFRRRFRLSLIGIPCARCHLRCLCFARFCFAAGAGGRVRSSFAKARSGTFICGFEFPSEELRPVKISVGPQNTHTSSMGEGLRTEKFTHAR